MSGAWTGPPPPPFRPGWGFRDVAITLVGAFLVGNLLAAALIFGGFRDWSPTPKAWATLLVLVVPWLPLAGWPLLASKRKGQGPVLDFGLTVNGRAVLVGIGFGLAGLVTASTVAAVQESIMGRGFTSRAADVATEVASGSHLALWIFALCTAFGAPVVEELAFRGLTFGAFRLIGQPVVWSVVWTTVLFAVFHFEPVRLPVLLVLGAWLGAARAVTGRTSASMIAHMTVNIPGAIGILAAAGVL